MVCCSWCVFVCVCVCVCEWVFLCVCSLFTASLCVHLDGLNAQIPNMGHHTWPQVTFFFFSFFLFWHGKLLTNSLLWDWKDLAYYTYCFIYLIYRVTRRHNGERITNAKLKTVEHSKHSDNLHPIPTEQYKIMTTIIITLSFSYFLILLLLFTKISSVVEQPLVLWFVNEMTELWG